MENYYNLIWYDAISSFRKHHPERKNWKVTLLIFLSWINAINLWIILIWLKYFNILTVPRIDIDIFPGSVLDDFISFAIEFAAPFVLLNYFFIFHNNRYEKIINKYNGVKFRYAPFYSSIIAILGLFSAMLYMALK